MRKNHLSALRKLFLASLLPLLLSCSTSDTTLRESGRSDAYIAGFHDGRRSGMNEAGNYLTRPTSPPINFSSPHKREAKGDHFADIASGDAAPA